MSINVTYKGWLTNTTDIEGNIFLAFGGEPLSKTLQWMSGKNVNVEYWVSEKADTLDNIEENSTRILFGELEAKYQSHYSELTGYLWTDDDLTIGGHDLINELQSYVGKYLILRIKDHTNNDSVTDLMHFLIDQTHK